MNRPNILYIHSHDTGRYIQPYGYAVPTPALQRFAEQGVLFRQAFTANPTCSPSRASLLTGQCAHNCMLGLAHRGFDMFDYSRHIIHTLKPHGYTTALAGIQHIIEGCRREEIGYDHYYIDDGLDGALEFLNSEHASEPWFLSAGFFETHRDFPTDLPENDSTLDPRYCRPPTPLPDTPDNRLDMAEYMLSARHLDQKMGRIFAELDARGLAENTFVICTTDHGIAFPHMKCNLYDHGTGIMLMMRGPGGFTGGKVIDSLVSQIDVFPTVCDLLGIDHPDWLQGVSLLPLVKDECEHVRDEVHTEVNVHAGYEPMRSVRTTRYKYIRRYNNRATPVLCNCDDGYCKTHWVDHGWRDRAVEEEMLFDLVFDPNECNNLADDPALTDVLDDLRGRLERWMEATDDPLLRGPLTLPAGAIVNDSDALSPKDRPDRE